MANRPGQLENSMIQNLEIPHIHPLNKVVINKVIIEKSLGEGSLMEQDTIENVS